MIIKTRNYLTLLVAVCIAFGCSDDDISSPKKIQFGIGNATGIFLTEGHWDGTLEKKLLLIEDNNVTELSIEDESGNRIEESFTPKDLRKVSDEYLHIEFEEGDYLIRKSDGRAISFGKYAPKGRLNGYRGKPYVIAGDSLFYISKNKDLIKLNLSNFESSNFEVLSKRGDDIQYFCTDGKGTFVYIGKKKDKGFINLRKYDGTHHSIRYIDPSCSNVLLPGLEGDEIFVSNDCQGILKINKHNPNCIYDDSEERLPYTSYKDFLSIEDKRSYILLYKDGVFVLKGERDCFEDMENGNITAFTNSDTHYYFSVKKSWNAYSYLYKIDPEEKKSKILFEDRYHVNCIDSSPDNQLLFGAEDSKNKSIVIGKIDASGNYEILHYKPDSPVYSICILN